MCIRDRDLAAAVMKSEEYTEEDLGRTFEALNRVLDFLAPSLGEYNALTALPEILVPVTFVHGSHDLNTPIDLAKTFYEAVSAPSGKAWVEFKESAHLPMYEEPAKFLEVLKAVPIAKQP